MLLRNTGYRTNEESRKLGKEQKNTERGWEGRGDNSSSPLPLLCPIFCAAEIWKTPYSCGNACYAGYKCNFSLSNFVVFEYFAVTPFFLSMPALKEKMDCESPASHWLNVSVARLLSSCLPWGIHVFYVSIFCRSVEDESAEYHFCESRQLNMSTLRMTSEAKVRL